MPFILLFNILALPDQQPNFSNIHHPSCTGFSATLMYSFLQHPTLSHSIQTGNSMWLINNSYMITVCLFSPQLTSHATTHNSNVTSIFISPRVYISWYAFSIQSVFALLVSLYTICSPVLPPLSKKVICTKSTAQFPIQILLIVHLISSQIVILKSTDIKIVTKTQYIDFSSANSRYNTMSNCMKLLLPTYSLHSKVKYSWLFSNREI